MSNENQKDVSKDTLNHDDGDADMREIDSYLEGETRSDSAIDMPPTPTSSHQSSRNPTPSPDETSESPASEQKSSAVRKRIGKIYPPRAALGKRDLLMHIDFHQISVQVQSYQCRV